MSEAKMILTDYFLSEKSLQWDYAKQMGINHAVIRLPEDKDFNMCDKEHWRQVYNRFTSYGIKPVVLEPMPNCVHDHIKLGDDRRDESIEKVIKMLKIMDELDIRLICFNFMAHIGWYRSSSNILERGGALVTGFNINDYMANDNFTITEEELWYNYEYFLKAVIPYAEKYGVKLALHPDDPPVSKLGGVSRILTSMEKVDKAINLVKSDYLGVTLCQGTYSAMGEDITRVIRHFSGNGKVLFVHFRDICGNKNNFHETFHDNGQTDMAETIKVYLESGVSCPIRVDHVPTMAGEDNTIPGYAAVGRLFAVGYLKGLLDATGYSYM